jgi:hypothetical protein
MCNIYIYIYIIIHNLIGTHGVIAWTVKTRHSNIIVRNQINRYLGGCFEDGSDKIGQRNGVLDVKILVDDFETLRLYII